MLHILVHTDLSMKFWYCISATLILFSKFFLGLATYPWHHVIILVQMTQLVLNIYITQISVVGDRQFKYSAFIPISPWSALSNSSHVLIQYFNPSSFHVTHVHCVQLHKINVISIRWIYCLWASDSIPLFSQFKVQSHILTSPWSDNH